MGRAGEGKQELLLDEVDRFALDPLDDMVDYRRQRLQRFRSELEEAKNALGSSSLPDLWPLANTLHGNWELIGDLDASYLADLLALLPLHCFGESSDSSIENWLERSFDQSGVILPFGTMLEKKAKELLNGSSRDLRRLLHGPMPISADQLRKDLKRTVIDRCLDFLARQAAGQIIAKQPEQRLAAIFGPPDDGSSLGQARVALDHAYPDGLPWFRPVKLATALREAYRRMDGRIGRELGNGQVEVAAHLIGQLWPKAMHSYAEIFDSWDRKRDLEDVWLDCYGYNDEVESANERRINRYEGTI